MDILQGCELRIGSESVIIGNGTGYRKSGNISLETKAEKRYEWRKIFDDVKAHNGL